MISYLPVELVGANVLSFLSLRDIIILERACNSEESHQLLLNSIPYCHPVELPNIKHDNISTLNWFSKRRFKLDLLVVLVTRNNPILKVKNLHVRKLDLRFQTKDNLILYKTWLENDITFCIILLVCRCLYIYKNNWSLVNQYYCDIPPTELANPFHRLSRRRPLPCLSKYRIQSYRF